MTVLSISLFPPSIGMVDNGDVRPPLAVFDCCGVFFFFHSALACSINDSLCLYSRSSSALLERLFKDDWCQRP